MVFRGSSALAYGRTNCCGKMQVSKDRGRCAPITTLYPPDSESLTFMGKTSTEAHESLLTSESKRMPTLVLAVLPNVEGVIT